MSFVKTQKAMYVYNICVKHFTKVSEISILLLTKMNKNRFQGYFWFLNVNSTELSYEICMFIKSDQLFTIWRA